MNRDEAHALAAICEAVYDNTVRKYEEYFVKELLLTKEYAELEDAYEAFTHIYSIKDVILPDYLRLIVSYLAEYKARTYIIKDFDKYLFEQELLLKPLPDTEWFKKKFIEEYFAPLTYNKC